jgi:hypothetical protein
MDTSPLKIGYCLSLSGGLASNGKTAQLAHQIWQETINQNGKLLGRPVELVCLDDHESEFFDALEPRFRFHAHSAPYRIAKRLPYDQQRRLTDRLRNDFRNSDL